MAEALAHDTLLDVTLDRKRFRRRCARCFFRILGISHSDPFSVLFLLAAFYRGRCSCLCRRALLLASARISMSALEKPGSPDGRTVLHVSHLCGPPPSPIVPR